MVFSLALSLLTFAGMQVFKDQLSTEGYMTILGGFIGSWFFIFFMNVSEYAVFFSPLKLSGWASFRIFWLLMHH